MPLAASSAAVAVCRTLRLLDAGGVVQRWG